MHVLLPRSIATVAGVLPAFAVSAQEHPFLADYALTEFDGGIRIEWVLQGGSTCNGQDVERSAEGIVFQPVHRILGICGDPTVAVPFSWIDEAPPEFSTVHYRIKLGIDGYSSVKSLFFDQLTTSEQRFFPSPMAQEATLVLNVPAASPVQLSIWNSGGQLVLEREDVPGPVIPIRLPQASPGVYVYSATSGGKVFTGRFVKE